MTVKTMRAVSRGGGRDAGMTSSSTAAATATATATAARARRGRTQRRHGAFCPQPVTVPIRCVSRAAAIANGQSEAPPQSSAPRSSSPFQAVLSPGEQAARISSVEVLKRIRLITAVKTPYMRNTAKVDLTAYDSILEHQILNGVQGVIVGGTTGEGQLMSWDEHIMLIAHTVNKFGDKIKVIGNTGSNATREAMHATEQGFAVGMHAALQINPYYGKTSMDGLLKHFESVLDLGPAILYNVPARTSQDMPPEFIWQVADHENFLGVKECEGNERIRAYSERGISTWSGNDDECHSSRYDAGATGVISVTSNVVPGLFHKLMFDGQDNDLNDELQPLISWIFQQPNPIGINTLMAMLGVCEPVFRLPYVPLRASERERGVELLRVLGHGHFPGDGGIIRALDDGEFELISSY